MNNNSSSFNENVGKKTKSPLTDKPIDVDGVESQADFVDENSLIETEQRKSVEEQESKLNFKNEYF